MYINTHVCKLLSLLIIVREFIQQIKRYEDVQNLITLQLSALLTNLQRNFVALTI